MPVIRNHSTANVGNSAVIWWYIWKKYGESRSK